MPSHIHAILQAENLSDVIRDFKAFTAKEIVKQIKVNETESRKEWLNYMFHFYSKYQKQNKDFQFWQKTNHPIELYDNYIFQQKLDYIHKNPVVAGMVTQEESWKYSSANNFAIFKIDEA